MPDIFVAGPLRHGPLLHVVLGGDPPLSASDAWIGDVELGLGPDGLTRHSAPGQRLTGDLLVHLPVGIRERLEHYAAALGWDVQTRSVNVDDDTRAVVSVLPPVGQGVVAEPWELTDWRAAWGEIETETAVELMALVGVLSPRALRSRLPMMRVRADARVRAAGESPVVRLREGFARNDVTVHAVRRPYTGFFAVEERDISFRRFGGGMGTPVPRAAFQLADVVTVLPYDPVRDRVLLIEQFRFAPLVRGDRVPWSIEVVAGLIDPGETPEQAARREAREEAGLDLAALEPIGRYYPSPGAMTEYHFAFVGLADLPDGSAVSGGLASENEDIRGHLLGFDALMEFLTSGEAENAPLLLSALWLARNRDRLRGAA